jgi:mono/diheme cytochrome c family protein
MSGKMMVPSAALAMSAMLAAAIPGGPARTDSAGVVGANTFPQRDGNALYATICAGCHMPDAEGAVGAGTYIALADNKNLEGASYPVYVVLYGQKAMPGFGGFLDDAQVAAVVKYVRGNFGNNYRDPLSADDVKAMRQPGYEYFALD